MRLARLLGLGGESGSSRGGETKSCSLTHRGREQVFVLFPNLTLRLLKEDEMSAPAQTLTPQPGSTTTQAGSGSTTNWAPTAKVSVGILAASMTTLLLPLLGKANISLEPAQAAALTTLVTFAIQYMVPERR